MTEPAITEPLGTEPLGTDPLGTEPSITADGIDAKLADVRRGLDRLHPREAYAAVADGAVLIDTRPEFQRRSDGTIPGALVIERNHLEWRCDPSSGAAVPEATDADVLWIVLCDEGYASSLAADSLRAIGLARATDMIGGFQAWRRAGLPVSPSSAGRSLTA